MRDVHQRAGEKEALQILRSVGLEDDPIARLVVRQVRRLEVAASRIEARAVSRKWFDGKGNPKQNFTTFVNTVDKLLGEARALLTMLAGRGRTSDDEVTYTVRLEDGRSITEATTDTSEASIASVEPAGEADGTISTTGDSAA